MNDEKKERINFVSEKLAALAQAEIARAERLVEAREEGRLAGLREAAEICRQRSAKCSSFGASYHAISCDGDAEAITRAAEGKK
jgi:hypothetical protein